MKTGELITKFNSVNYSNNITHFMSQSARESLNCVREYRKK